VAIKPLDLQTNILHMDKAVKEMSKQKEMDIELQKLAAALQEKKTIEQENKIEEVAFLDPSLQVLDREEKDRNQKFQEKKEKKQEKEKEKKKNTSDSLFKDPSKGRLIDIKE